MYTNYLKPNLTEVRLLKKVNEAPQDASEIRSQSAVRGAKMSVELCERETRNVEIKKTGLIEYQYCEAPYLFADTSKRRCGKFVTPTAATLVSESATVVTVYTQNYAVYVFITGPHSFAQ